MSVTTKQQLQGQFNLTSSYNTMTVAGETVTLDTGLTFIKGYTGESATQLLEDMQAKIRAADGGLVNMTVTLDDTTGLVSLTFEAATTVVWTDAGLAGLLGWTSSDTLTGLPVYTANRHPRYMWRPTLPASEYPLTLEGGWMPRSTGHVYRSKDGGVGGIAGTKIYEALIEFSGLPEADVITPSTGTTYRDLQQFWLDIISEGRGVRYQPDRTVWTSAGVLSGLVGIGDDEGGAIGSFADWASRKIKSYNGLWEVTMKIWKRTE